MKKIIIFSLIICIIIGATLIYFVTNTPQHATGKTEAKKTYRIAILTPITHPALEEVEQGFKERMATLSPTKPEFTIFNASGNKTLMQAQAQEIINDTYDLICTLGAAASQTIAELERKKGIKIPHVFCAVDDQAFAHHLADINSATTGVYVKTDYKKEMDILHEFKPNTKNVLLVYDPMHSIGLEKDKQEIEHYLKKYAINLHAIEIYQPNEISQKVAALLPGIDVVLVLIDNTVVAGIDALITLCNRYGITLLVSDLNSGKKGAALAYGISDYGSGERAAELAFDILFYNEPPHEIFIGAITSFRLAINKDAAKKQNVEVK